MKNKGIHIQSYEYLGMNYFIKINGKNYTLSELTDEQLNRLIDINEKDKNREFRYQLLYIFNDVKRFRRKEKLQKLCLE